MALNDSMAYLTSSMCSLAHITLVAMLSAMILQLRCNVIGYCLVIGYYLCC